jgi:hypothetical protein
MRQEIQAKNVCLSSGKSTNTVILLIGMKQLIRLCVLNVAVERIKTGHAGFDRIFLIIILGGNTSFWEVLPLFV